MFRRKPVPVRYAMLKIGTEQQPCPVYLNVDGYLTVHTGLGIFIIEDEGRAVDPTGTYPDRQCYTISKELYHELQKGLGL